MLDNILLVGIFLFMLGFGVLASWADGPTWDEDDEKLVEEDKKWYAKHDSGDDSSPTKMTQDELHHLLDVQRVLLLPLPMWSVEQLLKLRK